MRKPNKYVIAQVLITVQALGLVAWLLIFFHDDQRSAALSTFEGRIQQLEQQIEGEFRAVQQQFRSLVAFYRASNKVTRDEFEQFLWTSNGYRQLKEQNFQAYTKWGWISAEGAADANILGRAGQPLKALQTDNTAIRQFFETVSAEAGPGASENVFGLRSLSIVELNAIRNGLILAQPIFRIHKFDLQPKLRGVVFVVVDTQKMMRGIVYDDVDELQVVRNRFRSMIALHETSPSVSKKDFERFIGMIGSLGPISGASSAASIKWGWLSPHETGEQSFVGGPNQPARFIDLKNEELEAFYKKVTIDTKNQSELSTYSLQALPVREASEMEHGFIFAKPLFAHPHYNSVPRKRGVLFAIVDASELLHEAQSAAEMYLSATTRFVRDGVELFNESGDQVFSSSVLDHARPFWIGRLDAARYSSIGVMPGQFEVFWKGYNAVGSYKPTWFHTLIFATVVVSCLLTNLFINRMAKLNAKLIEQRDLANEANRAKSDFLATMSHEIRTPLNGIIGLADLLAKEKRPVRDLERLDTLTRSAEGLVKIIDDILEFSRVEGRYVRLDNSPFSVRGIIHHIRGTYQPLAENKCLAFDIQWAPEVPETLLGDEHRIRQILNNLVGNSLKFTSAGSITIRIRYDKQVAYGKAPDLVFVVSDTGIGISKEATSRIFERFSQADGGTTRKYGGAGLGLSISVQLARLMGGDIAVESEVGVGSTFTARIPAPFVDGHGGEAKTVSSSGTGAATVKQKPTSATEFSSQFGKHKILIAEDDHVNRLYIGQLLEGLGQDVSFAVNGDMVVAMAKAEKFDLILMDCLMPVCDGFEATRRLRSEISAGKIDNIKIIALTANAFVSDRKNCLDAGMDAFLSKPVREPELVAELSKFLERSSNNSEIQLVDCARCEPATSSNDESKPVYREESQSQHWGASNGSDEPGGSPSGAEEDVNWETFRKLEISMSDRFPEMRQSFLNDLRHHATSVASACSEGRMQELMRVAHTIKSAAKLFGFVSLSATAGCLEKHARSTIENGKGEIDGTKIDALVSSIDKAIYKLCTT